MNKYTETDARIAWIEQLSKDGFPSPSRLELAAFMDGFRAARAQLPEVVARPEDEIWNEAIEAAASALIDDFYSIDGVSTAAQRYAVLDLKRHGPQKSGVTE